MEVLIRTTSGFGTPMDTSPFGSSPAPEGDAARKRNVPSRNKNAAKTNIGFTFVDQSEDLKSLADKRIVSSTQRHAIRSHVMKSVRHSENLVGKKRPTGRENTRRTNAKTARSLPLIQCELVSLASSTASSPGFEASGTRTPNSSSPLSSLSSLSSSSEHTEQQLMQIPTDPSPRFDPFYSLPGNDGPAYNLIETLVRYCFETFLPMTFPVERNGIAGELIMRRGIILRSKIANPGSFFGLMAICAAHRAITSQRHSDLKPSSCDHDLLLFDNDYAMMKGYAIRATHVYTAERRTIDSEAMEATFSLIGASTIVGNFKEARIHLEGMRRNLTPDNGILDPSVPATAFIPISDIKAATGMMSRPLFAVPWTTDPAVDSRLLAKITPHTSPMKDMGHSFLQLNQRNGLNWALSTKIQEKLQIAIALCWFSQANVDSPRLLTSIDFETFRRKAIELEHGILDYVFDDSSSQPLAVPPLEHLIRVTVLGLVSSFISQALPSAGLGRALTSHQRKAYDDYVHSLSYSQAPTVLERRLIIWAVFQFVHGASGQIEEPAFLELLSEQLKVLQIESWAELETLLYSFLYVPTFQSRIWYRIWERAEDLWRRREGSVTSWSTVSPPSQVQIE